MPSIEKFLNSGALFSTSPGFLFLGWGKYSWSSAPHEVIHNQPSFYFPDFFLDHQKPWCCFEEGCEISVHKLIEHLEASDEPQREEAPLEWIRTPKSDFVMSYELLKKRLFDESLEKGVPYIFETAQASMTRSRLRNSLLTMLRSLLNQPLYAYGFWDTSSGLLGATPELLFRSDSSKLQQIETMACAGTIRSEGVDTLFFQDPKERHEHQLVIEGIKTSLEELGANLKFQETKLLKLPLLNHLLTPMTATFSKDILFEDIVRALHPTPALGTLPRKAGSNWLKEEDKKLPRYRYGAPAALRRAHQSICIVAIRNVQWYDQWMGIGAGCGVVKESILEGEWAELQLKIASIKKVLGL